MAFNLRSIALCSASIAAAPLCEGPVALVPPGAGRVDPAADPVVTDDPDELAVPALLVPGDGGEASFDELPAPLGSLPELLRPPALAGPDGTPLTPAVIQRQRGMLVPCRNDFGSSPLNREACDRRRTSCAN
jgi:hypothetical protein